jgi:hypothetical protein
VAYHQDSPTSPVKIVVVSLGGRAIAPGHGPVVRLKTRGGRGKLRLIQARVAD